MNSGNFGAVTTGAGMSLGAQADAATMSPTTRRTASLRICKILPRRRLESRHETSRNVCHDRNAAVTHLMKNHASVPIHAPDLLAIGGALEVERDGDSPDVERQARGDRFNQLIHAVSLER